MAESKPKKTDGRSGRYVVIGFVIAIILLLLSGILPRLSRQKRVEAEAGEVTAAPMVTVAAAKLGDPANVLMLPATLYGLHETGLYVRTNGYVKSIRVDMGSHVRAGDTLAIVEMPDWIRS